MAASANGHLSCLRALVGDGDEDVSGGGGDAGATNQAAPPPQAAVAELLDTQDGEGRTALMHACMFDQVGGSRQASSG